MKEATSNESLQSFAVENSIGKEDIAYLIFPIRLSQKFTFSTLDSSFSS